MCNLGIFQVSFFFIRKKLTAFLFISFEKIYSLSQSGPILQEGQRAEPGTVHLLHNSNVIMGAVYFAIAHVCPGDWNYLIHWFHSSVVCHKRLKKNPTHFLAPCLQGLPVNLTEVTDSHPAPHVSPPS